MMNTAAEPRGVMTQVDTAQDLRETYARDGFIVVRDGLTSEEIDQLRADAARICRGEYGEFRGLERAVADETDDQVMQRYLCIHFPHKISPVMHRALSHSAVVDVLTQIIGPNVKSMQSMLFIKAAGKPGQAWHQDEFFIPTRDRSLCGAWIAMDDATVENGCLWVIPGSHRHGILWPQEEHDDRRFDCAGEAVDFPYTDDDAVPVELETGSFVIFNGYLLHRSLPNVARTGYRRALANHYMSAESLLPWLPSKDQPVATHDFRDIVLVAGRDPYEWKGTTDVMVPHVRPSGEGGCGDARTNLRSG